jgi:hypothetical protein
MFFFLNYLFKFLVYYNACLSFIFNDKITAVVVSWCITRTSYSTNYYVIVIEDRSAQGVRSVSECIIHKNTKVIDA